MTISARIVADAGAPWASAVRAGLSDQRLAVVRDRLAVVDDASAAAAAARVVGHAELPVANASPLSNQASPTDFT
jgi:hypothetical protein